MSVTVPATLQQDVIMASALKAFSRTFDSLMAFSVGFNNIPLQGSDKIQVPFFPLETAASKNFSPGTGYELGDSYTQETREVTINKRKYQPLSLSSAQLARQPHISLEKIGEEKGRKLAEDVIQDILSGITAANFGAPIYTGSADLFDFSVVNETIGTACDDAKWPEGGRTIIAKSGHYRNLVTDLGDASAYASDNPAKRGVLEDVAGFDLRKENTIPVNGENLVGFACMPAAMLIGFSPIAPADPTKVVNYQTTSDAQGLTLEYREWFDPTTDVLVKVIECNYGFATGNANALKRIVSA